MTIFTTNRHFRRRYNQIFQHSPLAANVFLLLTELASERGDVRLESPFPEAEIQRLMAARFSDPRAYQLEGGP